MAVHRRATEAQKKMSNATLEVLIDYYASDMQRRNLRPDTVGSSRRTLLRFARWLPAGTGTPLNAVTIACADKYVTDMQSRTQRCVDHATRPAVDGGLSPFTIARQVKELKVFGGWLKREGFIDPFGHLKNPKTPKRVVDTLNDEEIGTIVGTMNPHTTIGGRLYAMILLMLDSGLRISEVAEARLPNLDMRARQLEVMGKGQKERLVPFGAVCAQALMRYVNLHRPKPQRADIDQLFLSMDGLPITRGGLESIIFRLRNASGVKRLHAHLLRHTFAVRFLTNGGDLETLRNVMGHESLEVTKVYLNFSKQQASARYHGFSPVDRMPLDGVRRFGKKRKQEQPER